MRDGLGNQIDAFHEGDGTDIRTVYEGDGTVLWDAIPDSDTHQYRMEEGSGTTLIDSRGDVDATLVGGGWDTSPVSWFDQETTHDGLDDYWVTDNSVTCNTQEYSVWIWFTRGGAGDDTAWLLQTHDNPDGTASSGYDIVCREGGSREGEILFRHCDNGPTSTIDSGSGTTSTDTPYFFSASGDGDSVDMWIRDTDSEVFHGSGTASRAVTDTEPLMGMARDSSYLSGSVIAVGVSDQQYTEQEFIDIWDATR